MLPNYQISDERQIRLRKDGWYPGRTVDDATIQKRCLPIIQKTRCRIFPAAIRILKEYGGLTIKSSDKDRTPMIVWPPRDHSALSLFQLEWELNQVLFPIAHLAQREIDYFVNPQGEIYGDCNISGYVHYFGNSFEAAIDQGGLGKDQQRVLELPRKLDRARWEEQREEAQKYFSWMTP